MLKILIALALLCSHLEAVEVAANVSKRVAVIGAGAAGIAAAQLLKEHGFRVTIYEKATQVGGKCMSRKCANGRGIVELGAIQVGIGYPIVTHYLKTVGMKLRDYWPSRAIYYEDNDGTYTTTYKTLSEDFWPLRDFKDIAREARVMHDALGRYQPIFESNFTEIPEGSEFVQPFATWADSLSLEHFKREYGIWMTAYGYGQLQTIPTYLALSLLNSSYGLIAMRKANMNLRMIEGGYGGLMARIIEHYDLDVQTNVRVERIERTDDRVRITYEDEYHHITRTEEFGYLVVASGIENIQRALKVTPEERYLAQDIRYSPYDVVIAEVPSLAKGGYIMPQFFSSYGHVVMVSKNSSGGDEAILYVPRATYQRPRPDELAKSVKGDLALFGFNDAKILEIAYWDNYFPHFKTPSSYKLLNDIQGSNRTIYVGSAARFEIVERAMRDAWDNVWEHILHEKPPTGDEGLTATFKVAKDYLLAQPKER